MVFGQGTATNTGVVGLDNGWVNAYPFFHDFPGSTVRLTGQNFKTENMLSSAPHDEVYTGPYSPFGVPATAGETVKGTVRASGSILSANEDGSDLRLTAWGLRNPFRVRFDRSGRLISTNHGMDVRGSRPVANSPDELYFIEEGAWYGWPDYTSGYPVTLAQFRPDNGPRPEFILAEHPMQPPKPFAVFEPHAAIMGFDFNYGQEFPGAGDIYLAEFGSEAPETTGGKPSPYVGHRVSRISPDSGRIFTFAINKSGVAASASGEGGFERPIDVKFGPDGGMYIADFGLGEEDEGFIAGSGVIWRIRRTTG
jgi:glucose/arabinose dehydrogenase